MTSTDLVVEAMFGAGPFDVVGDFYLNVPRTSGANATTPDHASLDITGDIHIRAEVTLDDWTPLQNRTFAAKYGSAGNRSWWFALSTTGRMFFQWSVDGTALIQRTCPLPLPAESGRLAVGVKFDASNGGNHVATFETASSIGGAWTDLASDTGSGTTSIFNSSAVLEAGAAASGLSPLGGRLHKLEVRNGIGGSLVANPDFTAQNPGTTSFSDGSGRTWTVNSPAAIVGYTWTDISDRLLYAEWTYGRDNELDPFEPGSGGVILKNDDRVLDPEFSTGPHFGKLKPRTPMRLRSVATALDLPGAGGATASTPDHSTFNVTDLDVRARLALDDWTPGGFGQFVVGQWPGGSNLGWVLVVQPSGVLRLATTANGTTTIDHDSTAATGFTDGSDHWIRATIDVDNGASGHDVRFYTSDDGVVWTQLGNTVTTGGTTSIFNSTGVLAVGDVLSLAGQVRYVEVRDGIDGSIVTNPEFSSQPAGTTLFKCPQGRTWTVNGTAAIALDTAVVQDEFYGFVEGGWEQEYKPPALANCRVQLIDMLGVITGASLPQTAYELEVLADNPALYWRHDETSGALQALDSSGFGRHGTIDNGSLGEDPLIVGEGHSAFFPLAADSRVWWSGQGLPVGAPCSLEAWVKLSRALLNVKSIIVAQRDSSVSSALWLKCDSSVGSPNGELLIHFHGLGGYKARGHVPIDDEKRHYVVCTIAGTSNSDVLLYVDGQLQTKTTVTAGTNNAWASHLLWTVGNTIDNGVGDFGLGGYVDEAAIYDKVLTPTQVTAHYQAGATGGDGDRSGTRIGDVFDHIGLPSSMRAIAEGDTTVGPANYGGQKAGPYLDSVVESEQGALYVDHRNAGKVTFVGRYARLTDPRSTTTLHTFTDADTSASLHYERGIKVDPGTAKNVVNIVDVNWRGGTVQVVDPNNSHLPGGLGPQSRTITTESPTASAAANAGGWIINNYATPQPRVRAFTLNPGADKRLRRPARDLRISDRIATVRQPQGVGSATTNLLYVEGLTHTFEKGVGHTVEVVTSTAVLGNWAKWGVSTWDGATWG